MTKPGPSTPLIDQTHALAITGELDLNSVADVERAGLRALSDSSVTTLALDLHGVTFIDSTGIGTLVRLRLAADEHSKHLILIAPSEAVTRVLTLTGLTATFVIEPAAATVEPA